MKSLSETQFLSLVSNSSAYNNLTVCRNVYREFLVGLIAKAREFVEKDPSDNFFVLLVPVITDSNLTKQTSLDSLEFSITKYTVYLHNNSRGYSEDLNLTLYVNGENIVVKAIDELSDNNDFVKLSMN